MRMDKEKHQPEKGVRKTFQQDGRWIIRSRVSPIVICACGNRYIKTRPYQRVCLWCISRKIAKA